MAKVREDTMNIDDTTLKFVGVALENCLTEEQDKILKKRWEEHGGYEVTPWWQWCLDNIEVSLKGD